MKFKFLTKRTYTLTGEKSVILKRVLKRQEKY